MKRRRDEAYVLATQDLGEADRIVTLLCADHGKVRAVARAARNSRRRFGGLLEPLTQVRAEWVEFPGRDLHRLEGLEGLRSFAAMQSDPLRQAACAVVCEISMNFAHEGQGDRQVFRLIGAVVAALEARRPPRPLLRYFEFWMLRLHGLLPDFDHCAACGRGIGGDRLQFGARSGPRCQACPLDADERGGILLPGDRTFLEAVRHKPPGELPAKGGESGALELLLRGTLESFAERGFRTYRHFSAAESVVHPRGTE